MCEENIRASLARKRFAIVLTGCLDLLAFAIAPVPVSLMSLCERLDSRFDRMRHHRLEQTSRVVDSAVVPADDLGNYLSFQS